VARAHRLGAEVGVAAGAVPVAADGLGRKRSAGAEVLADAVEQPAGHPQVVGDSRAADRADLELPLSGHNLSVDAGNLQTGLEASVQVSLDHGASEDLVGANAAVVATLGRGETARGEAKGPGTVEERVLLLDTE